MIKFTSYFQTYIMIIITVEPD